MNSHKSPCFAAIGTRGLVDDEGKVRYSARTGVSTLLVCRSSEPPLMAESLG